MNEIMTLKEINQRFDSEWVLIGDPEVTPELEIIRGKVLCHSKDRDEMYQKAVELKPKHSATHYTGKWSKNEAIIL